ncbi:hypothetical protein MKW92_035827 [Papaver armeniacum]|nr:hypothetical protein MKW92_035827 [Papaver armeniacum]
MNDCYQAQVWRVMDPCTYCSNQGVKVGLFRQIVLFGFFSYFVHFSFVITNCLFLPMLAPVLYIVLPTLAYEHTNFVGPFSRKFPRAQTWVAPRRWSWPLNFSCEFFGIFCSKPLIDEDLSTPWGNEIEQKVVSSLEVGV